jgi:hypothetical protein
MKLSKKIFIIIKSLSIVAIISSIISAALSSIFTVPFWSVFILVSMIQLLFPSCYDLFMDKIIIKRQLDIYNAKEYKRYPIQTACQHCGDITTRALNLDDSQYRCDNCGKDNAIHVTYMVAAIQSAPNTYNL